MATIKEEKQEPVIHTEVKPEAMDPNSTLATKEREPTKSGGTCISGHGRGDSSSSLWCWTCFSCDSDYDGSDDCDDCDDCGDCGDCGLWGRTAVLLVVSRAVLLVVSVAGSVAGSVARSVVVSVATCSVVCTCDDCEGCKQQS